MPPLMSTALALLVSLSATGLFAGTATDGTIARSPVTMHVTAGFNAYFQSNPAWVPVRVSMHNGGFNTLAGSVEIRDSTIANPGQVTQPYDALYARPVVLAAGSTKAVTLYLPGADIQGQFDVVFRRGSRVLATASAFPGDIQYSDVTVGALTNDLSSVAWLDRVTVPHATLRIVRLSASDLAPVPEVLATFDLIVLSNNTTASLDRAQLAALERYVRNGGSLLLIGGPDWMETVRPLPPTLVPGAISGSAPMSTLRGLGSLGLGDPPPQQTIASVLQHSRGAVFASGRSAGGATVPLVVQSGLGDGQIEYLAFDPALDPILHWARAPAFLTRLVTSAIPLVARRLALPSSYRFPSTLEPGDTPLDVGSELANIPAAALPSFILVIGLTVLYVILIGPVNFLILCRLRHADLAWGTVPALALLCIGSSFGVAYHLKGNSVLLNTVGAVLMDGGATDPATIYIGLFAPLRGDYRLTLDSPALPVPVLAPGSAGSPPIVQPPIGWRFEEGARTSVDFPSMNMWSMRAVALHTSIAIPGAVQTALQVTRSGDIAGVIRNLTPLHLVAPAIIAGRAVARLPDLPPESIVHVRVRPVSDVRLPGHPQMLFTVYGQASSYLSSVSCSFSLTSSCYAPNAAIAAAPAPKESALADRLRDAAGVLPESHTISMLGEVVFVAWTQDSLGSLSVEGATPQRRDLTLIVKPLSVDLPAGPFRLRTGTLGAHLLQETPANPHSGCCAPTVQPVYVGVGGAATFEFDIPRPGRARFRSLSIWANTSSNDSATSASAPTSRVAADVYDWQSRRWIRVTLHSGAAALPSPNRFISGTGALLLRLSATRSSGQFAVLEPHQDLQISGTAL